jgi:hypothetical protein
MKHNYINHLANNKNNTKRKANVQHFSLVSHLQYPIHHSLCLFFLLDLAHLHRKRATSPANSDSTPKTVDHLKSTQNHAITT